MTDFYTILNTILCGGARPQYKMMPYALGDILTMNLLDVDPQEALALANEVQALVSVKGFVPPTPGCEVNGISYSWLPGTREEDGVVHLYFPVTGKPLSTQAVETDLGFVLFSLAFNKYKTVLVHAYWADGRTVHGEISQGTREMAQAFVAKLSTVLGRRNTPGVVCRTCLQRGTCKDFLSLDRVGAVITPMPPSDRKQEAHRLWLNLIMLEEAEKKLTTNKKAVKDRMLQLASGGQVDVGGMFNLEVRQVEKENPKTGKKEMGDASLVKAGMNRSVPSVNLFFGLS